MSTQPARKFSLAAYLFMPQFGLSLQGLRDMGPIFVRTFAIILSQVGLINDRHPALGFSEQAIREQTLSKLIGEAWFNLKTGKSSIGQWGVFFGIVLMFCIMVVAVIAFVTSITFNVGNKVYAQVFTHPGNPYGAGVGQTDSATMAAAVGSPPPVGIFDFRVSGPDVSVDYALMVLDKALRQGAMGVGGASQNAFGSLMLVYNTAVLTIAGVILFWIILSVVVDTARTGQIGGGRHNMVWAPIRIIFALGLMIPLGSAGFSSGQFMVMKLAEWGSNLATVGWTEYINAVATDDSLVGAYVPDNPTEIVRGITQITTCQAANNYYAKEATVGFGAAANLNYDGYILSNSDAGAAGVSTGKTTVVYDKISDNGFGVEHDGTNYCGKIIFENPAVPDAKQAPLPDPDGTSFNMNQFRQALLNTNNRMKASLAQILTDSMPNNAYTGSYPSGANNLFRKSRELSCAYLRWSIPAPFPTGMNTIPQCLGVPNNICGGVYDPAAQVRRLPDVSCINDMMTLINTQMVTGFNDARSTYLLPYINNNILAVQERRGWASMGVFFYQITKINTVIAELEAPKVTFVPGQYTNGTLPGTTDYFLSGTLLGQALGYGDAEHDAKVMQTTLLFSQWWRSASNVGGRGVNPGLPAERQIQVNENDEEPKQDKGSYVTRKINEIIVGALEGAHFRNMAEGTAKQPLLQVIQVGNWLVGIGLSLITVLTIATAVLGFFTGGTKLFLAELLYLIAKTMTVTGLILTVWLPVVPIIRVGMAILTWIVSVFEAVVMVPIAALAHLSTEGEGIAGPAKQVWYLWLGVLLRPILTVVGFVGAFLIFNAFVLYFNKMFFESLEIMAASETNALSRGISYVLNYTVYIGIYVFIIYTVANTTFKLIDQIPNALAKWIGGQGDPSFDDKNDSAMIAALGAIKSVGLAKGTKWEDKKKEKERGVTKG